MILATTRVEDVDHFVKIFSTKAADARARYGSKGGFVFRDPNDEARVWAIFDWDETGFERFRAVPENAAMMQEAGLLEAPQDAQLVSRCRA